MVKMLVFRAIEWVVLHMEHQEAFACDQVWTTGWLRLWVTYEPLLYVGGSVWGKSWCLLVEA